MSTIWNFWISNPKFWIPITAADKAVADKTIFTVFYNYSSLHEESPIGQIIYYDQFFKHFQRVVPEGTISDTDIKKYRLKAVELLESSWTTIKESSDPIAIVFALMPLKHLAQWDRLFELIHTCDLSLTKGPLAKFYQDSYMKAYTEERIASSIISDHSAILGRYDPGSICDYYPEGLHGLPGTMTEEGDDAITRLHKALLHLDRTQPLTVSLSGGVDSMVLVTLLKHAGFNVNAVHLVYGNREESAQEYAFIATFCAHLYIPLKVYKIEWLRRTQMEREFYERATRDIRFMVYRSVAPENKVILGHIKEDIVENIWTNIACVQHLHDLKKMSPAEEQLGVKLIRPFLSEEKETIYTVARTLAVPYLKNTTPSWSNRGKFREHFHKAIKQQFGSEADRKIIEFAEAVAKQSATLDRILFQPILKSWDPESKTIDIGTALIAQLDVTGWSTIFEYVCHKYLGINKPSSRCIVAFKERLATSKGHIYMNMHGHLQIRLTNKILEFIIV